jgi:hydroxymethylpyrimidine/phosphomethylpyrimidine kinase
MEFLLTSLHWVVALSRNVLVKGGHLPGTGGMVDVLYDGAVEF